MSTKPAEPKELETTGQYPNCDHPEDLQTSLGTIELSVKYVGGIQTTEAANLYHCAKCEQVINWKTGDNYPFYDGITLRG